MSVDELSSQDQKGQAKKPPEAVLPAGPIEAESQVQAGGSDEVKPSLLLRCCQAWQSWSRPWIDRLFSCWVPSEHAQSLSWLEDADYARVTQDPIRTRSLLYVLALVVVLLLIWSAFAEVDQVTRGEGKVIPSSHVQVLQSLDGGVVTEIAVQEGDIVEAGQLLVQLDGTRFESTLGENRAEYLALKAKAIRLQAVADDTEFQVSPTLQQEAPSLVTQARRLYDSSRAELSAMQQIAKQQLVQRQQEVIEAQSRRDQAADSYRLTSRELDLTRPLVRSGAVSEVELLRLEREVSSSRGDRDQAVAQIARLQASIIEAQQKIQEVELEFKNQIREELSVVMARLSALQESSLGLSDRVKLTSVRSPVQGTVKRLFFKTVGGVVTPGKEVVEVVPLGDSLLLEARIQPQDIAFLRPNQEALVKFTAYDFVVYGGLPAVVEYIGADTVMDEEGNPFYVVRVRTRESSLGEDKPIIPGMVASVDILTGKKTILAYLLKPVLRAKQYALSER